MVDFNLLQDQFHNYKAMEKKHLINLVRSVITGKSQASVWDFLVLTSLSLYKLYDLLKLNLTWGCYSAIR